MSVKSVELENRIGDDNNSSVLNKTLALHWGNGLKRVTRGTQEVTHIGRHPATAEVTAASMGNNLVQSINLAAIQH